MEQMTMTQLLDERDFLKKKIESAIDSFVPGAVVRAMDKKLKNGMTIEEYEAKVKSTYQSINDNIARYNRIIAAIVQSNANTTIEVDGKTYSVAQAIQLRKEFVYNDNLELMLASCKERWRTSTITTMEKFQKEYDKQVENSTHALLSGDSKKEGPLTEEDVKIIDALTDKYKPVLVDPLGIVSSEEASIGEERHAFIKKLESAIKISNATTIVEF